MDTAETYGTPHDSEEYREGHEQTVFVRDWMAAATDTDGAWPLSVYTLKTAGKYGRALADVLDPDGKSLVAALFAEYGDAVRYGR